MSEHMIKMCIEHKWKTIEDDGIYKTKKCNHCKRVKKYRYKTKSEIEKMIAEKTKQNKEG